jgi:cold-inducible RNA-binding protein
MNTKLFVGNLSYNVTENDLQDLFAQHGPVSEVNLMMDRMSGRPRGFAFVTMGTEEAAQAAIEALNGKPLDGRNLTVNEARPREEGAGRSFGGGGGGGRGGDRGGDRGGRGGSGGGSGGPRRSQNRY